MANRAAKICIITLIFEGSTSAFFFPRSTKAPLPLPLKSAYLETLAVSGKHDNGASSTASSVIDSNNVLGNAHPVFPTQEIPVANNNNGGDKTKKSSPAEVSSARFGDSSSTKELGQKTAVNAELLTPQQQGSSIPPDPIPGANGWTRVEPEKKLRDAKVSSRKKASYESERQKYDQGFDHNSGFKSSREHNLGRNHHEAEDATVHKATVVEVIPKDPPVFEDAGSHDYLASKNMELERKNSDLLWENERQKFELESFLRGSLSAPLDHPIPDNRAPWHGDGLVEEHSRLKSENEMQRQDLQAIQSEMNGMESIIQSIEDRSYMETQKLENLNEELRNESERQKQQIEAYSLQTSNMQNLIQTIRDEAVSLQNEKRKLQTDNDLLIAKLQGSQGESERKLFELGSRNEQISDLQSVIETLRSDYSKLQNQQNLVVEDKETLETKFQESVGEFEKQRHELEAYKKDRASMESLVHSIRQESEALKSDKKELQDTIMDMKVAMEDMSQQHVTSQNKMNILNSEKEEMAARNQETQSRMQSQLQDSFSKLKQMSDEKTELDIRLQSLEDENERQRYEIENSSRDTRALEDMVQLMQNELEALKNEKKTLETTIVNLEQEKQKFEHQLTISKEEIERLQSEKDAALSQYTECYDHYQQLQLRFQEVVGELEACQGSRMMGPGLDYDGVDQDFMSRINNRQQNQMRRNQTNEPLNSSWWN